MDERMVDCVVVGSGPAGSACALELARRGWSVVLVDKATFPRPKVCGCCLNPAALASLERVGLGELPRRLAAVELTSWEFAAGGRRAVVAHPLGVSLSRQALDHTLVEAAIEAGARFLPGTRASLIPVSTSGQRELALSCDGVASVIAARIVVAATGLAELLSDDERHVEDESLHRNSIKIGAGAVVRGAQHGLLRHRIYMSSDVRGYVGMVVLEDDSVNVAAALRPECVKQVGGVGPLAQSIVVGSGLPTPSDLSGLEWKGTPRLTHASSAVAAERVYRIGDAASYVEPFTGEGIAWAMEDGISLAGILGSMHKPGDPAAETIWQETYRRNASARQAACRTVAAALRSRLLTAGMVRLLSVAPWLGRSVLKAIHSR